MALSAFDDKSHPPQEPALAKTLGNSYPLWNELQIRIASRFDPITVEWGFSSPKTGWGLRLKREKRTILYMTPCQGYFLASFALGEKAVQAAHTAGLPTAVLEAIDSAPKFAEGRGVRLEVCSDTDVRTVVDLSIIKMGN